MSPRYGRRRGIAIGVLAVLVAVAAFALYGGGDDADVSTVTETVTPTTPDKDKQKGKEKAKDGEGSASAAGGACGGTDQITRLRASGVSCGEASSVANEWQRRQNKCNTIDDPGSPIGFKRTCMVSGYKCTATRDTASDRRKVICKRGSRQIRFTFLP